MRTILITLLFISIFFVSEYGYSQPWQEAPTIGQDVATKTFHLVQNTPNPFTDHTLIQYTLNTNGAPITLCIYDVLGNLVETLVNEKQKNGAYAINYQANLRSGVYYCKLISGDRFLVIKMVCAR